MVESIAESAGLGYEEASAALDSLFRVITEVVSSGRTVDVDRFGSFFVSRRAARNGRNPLYRNRFPGGNFRPKGVSQKAV